MNLETFRELAAMEDPSDVSLAIYRRDVQGEPENAALSDLTRFQRIGDLSTG